MLWQEVKQLKYVYQKELPPYVYSICTICQFHLKFPNLYFGRYSKQLSSSRYSQFQRCPFFYSIIHLSWLVFDTILCSSGFSSMHLFQILYIFYGKKGRRAPLLSVTRTCLTTHMCSGIEMFSKSFLYHFCYSIWHFWLLLSTDPSSAF